MASRRTPLTKPSSDVTRCNQNGQGRTMRSLRVKANGGQWTRELLQDNFKDFKGWQVTNQKNLFHCWIYSTSLFLFKRQYLLGFRVLLLFWLEFCFDILCHMQKHDGRGLHITQLDEILPLLGGGWVCCIMGRRMCTEVWKLEWTREQNINSLPNIHFFKLAEPQLLSSISQPPWHIFHTFGQRYKEKLFITTSEDVS